MSLMKANAGDPPIFNSGSNLTEWMTMTYTIMQGHNLHENLEFTDFKLYYTDKVAHHDLLTDY